MVNLRLRWRRWRVREGSKAGSVAGKAEVELKEDIPEVGCKHGYEGKEKVGELEPRDEGNRDDQSGRSIAGT